MPNVMFVGGPRHGKYVDAAPKDEKERYRVPALSQKDQPVDYVSTKLILTFPDPLTGEVTGETWHTWVYVIPELYPDNPTSVQALQQAVGDAAMRYVVYANGNRTVGGPDAVKASTEPVYVAWCEECPDGEGEPQEFVDLRGRAAWMSTHKTTTGHQASWENR